MGHSMLPVCALAHLSTSRMAARSGTQGCEAQFKHQQSIPQQQNQHDTQVGPGSTVMLGHDEPSHLKHRAAHHPFATDDDYAGLQGVLADDPERGDLIKGGGGIRKLRYALSGRGKSGGVRAIYYWLREDHQIYMLLIYPKSKKDNLTDRETAILREFVKDL